VFPQIAHDFFLINESGKYGVKVTQPSWVAMHEAMLMMAAMQRSVTRDSQCLSVTKHLTAYSE
jgi:hypothetical protein